MTAAMVARLAADHLWQSTLFAVAAGLLTLAFRRSRANVRHAIWMAASIKFLVPCALLVAIGSAANVWTNVATPPPRPMTLAVAGVVAQPFTQQRFETPSSAQPERVAGWFRSIQAMRTVALIVWVVGTIVLLARWVMRWIDVARIARRATPLGSGEAVAALAQIERRSRRRRLPVLATGESIELGIFGVIQPVLLWPASIGARLSSDQVTAIVAHEVCHVRRRDNLTAAIQMVVESVFWFHPLVWWIGARLLDERERACDEAVLLLGNEPRGYAEGLVRLCEFYVESPVACVAGVTGSDLKSCISRIMRGDTGRALSRRGRTVLQATALCVACAPVAIAAMAPPAAIGLPAQRFFRIPRLMLAWAPRDASRTWNGNTRFASASLAASGTRTDGGYRVTPAGHFVATHVTARDLIQLAYSSEGRLWPEQVVSAPEWLTTEYWDISARAPEPFVNDAQGEPRALVAMLRNLLTDRFGLRLTTESRILPVYALVVADRAVAQSALRSPRRNCWRPGDDPVPATPMPPGTLCPSPLDGRLIESASMHWLAGVLTALSSSRHIIRDETGLSARYDFRLPQSGALDQLGLGLELRDEPVDVFVIERVNRPVLD